MVIYKCSDLTYDALFSIIGMPRGFCSCSLFLCITIMIQDWHNIEIDAIHFFSLTNHPEF
jgi:hypothetical protein